MQVFRMGISCDCATRLTVSENCFWVPWLWLRKINPQQRAQIPANERKYPQTSANLKYVFFRIHRCAKTWWRPAECTWIISWAHFQDINCTTTGQWWWQSWWNPGNVSAHDSVGIHAHVIPCPWLRSLGFKGLIRSIFFGGIANEHFFDKRAYISSSVYLCSFEAVGFCTFWLENVHRATTACTFSKLNFQKRSETVSFQHFWLQNVLRATTACTFSTSQLQKVVKTWCVLYIFTVKCASCHNGVHFFNISTSKSDPLLWCFVHFHFQMRFAPQRRAKPAGSAPATLASLLVDPPEPQIIGKTQWIATFNVSRAPASSFFWSFLFWLFSPLLFNCPYCRKFHF